MQADWFQLAVCALAIAYAGARLTQLADAIGTMTGMSGSWVGVLLLAAVTSLPELATGISAVTVAHAPNIAIGDALGSTVFNLALLVLLDVLHRPESIYKAASTGHILSAAFGVVLLGVVGISVLLSQDQVLPGLGTVGVYTPLLVVLYLLAMRSVFSYEQRAANQGQREDTPHDAAQRLRLRKAALQFGLFAGVVTVAGVWLPIVGGRIAD